MARIVRIASLVLTFAAASSIVPARAATTFGPVTIVACSGVMVGGNPQYGMVRIRYFNNTPNRVITAVTFRVRFHDKWNTITDQGHFSGKSVINHVFDTKTGSQYDGNDPKTCLVTSATFANGQVVNPT